MRAFYQFSIFPALRASDCPVSGGYLLFKAALGRRVHKSGAHDLITARNIRDSGISRFAAVVIFLYVR